MKMWLAFDIGCIECGESSEVIGLFPSRDEAEAAIQAWLQPRHRWGRKGRIGPHSEEVFEVEVPQFADAVARGPREG